MANETKTIELTDVEIEGLKRQIDETIGEATVLTPYRLAEKLTAIGQPTRPQMMYNYAKKGYLPTRLNATGHLEVTRDDAAEYMLKRLVKAASKA